MAAPKVFFVYLRRPENWKKDEQRDDPFYEFGSFGCTRCHSNNLLNPRHAAELQGARLAFVQGGQLGSRLVLLTPPITIIVRNDSCEAKWNPPEMPFKYTEAPILACNEGNSEFLMIEQFARSTKWGAAVESGLSSLLRSRTRPLCKEMAKEIVAVYTLKRSKALNSAIAEKYEQALPYNPPKIDRNREKTYAFFVKKLIAGSKSHCRRPPRFRPDD